uniref:Amino acid transporter n=1 Tax=Globisporangium ultimum (strain ATCC 200006 / CBS 805.95 / DAOM BR144) TaxID=431595 RepID=K3WWW6_GLOUD
MVLSPRSQTAYDLIETPSSVKADAPPTQTRAQRLKELYFGIPGILLGAVIGIFIGWGLQKGSPSEELMSWIGVPGSLFIRAIKCIVTPVVFCSLVVGMADMLAVGKASSIGVRTVLLYLTTTVIASCEGLVWVLIFRPYFGNKAQEVVSTTA